MSDETPEDHFDIGFRVFEREVVGLTLKSRSKARNWVVLSMICMVIMAAIFIEAAPVIKSLWGTS